MVKSADLLNQRPSPTIEQEPGDLLYNQKERVQNLSNEGQLTKLCTDAGFVKTVAPGQFFATKDAEEFSEFDGHVGCREYTLPRDDESSTPIGIRKLVLYRKSRPITVKESRQLRSELILYLEMDLILMGQN